jgi:hypothetical protein
VLGRRLPNNTYCIIARVTHGQIHELTDYIDTEMITKALLAL